MKKSTLRASVAFVFAVGMTPAIAHAADAPAAPAADAPATETGEGLTEIVVTAQKRAENLQDTPIAISVLRGEDLKNRNVVGLLDLGDGSIPSLKVAPFFSRPGALIVNVRGVGVLSDSNQPARDQGVGIYVDGVYLGRPQALGTALFEVENLEVLKGPQGTLFGRNTEGGAVNITSRKPTGEFGLRSTFGVGNYGSYKADVHIDFPEIANFSFKIDGVIDRRGAFVRNPYPGAGGFNSYDKRGLHVEWLWKPIDNFSANYSFDVSYDATTTLYQQLIAAPYAVPAGANPVTDPAIAAYVLAAVAPVQPNRVSVAPTGGPEQPSVGNTAGNRLTLEWKALDNLTLKSITAYRALTQTQFDNAGVASSFISRPTASFTNALFQRYSLAAFRQNQFSQELQAIGDFKRIKFAVGGLYYVERVQDNAQAPFIARFTDAAGSAFTVDVVNGYSTNALPAYVIQRASYVKTESIGVFGQATYTPPIANDIFHLTGGARWTRDTKKGTLILVNGSTPFVQINGVNTRVPDLDYSASRVDPLINLSIDVTRDIHVYGKWSTGYKSGGANSRSLTYARFNPETVSMFEAGFKGEFFDRRARLNIAAYTGTYKNIQLDFSGQYEDFVNGVRVVTTRTTTDTVNAPGTGRIKGVEAELTLAPFRGLQLGGSFAYNSVTIPDTLNPFRQTVNGVTVTPSTPQRIYQVYTPEYSASGSIDYETSYNDLKLRFHLDGNYDSGYYANYTDSLVDTTTRQARVVQPKGDKALIFNGRFTVADIDLGQGGAKLAVSAWARNLFNEQHVFLKFSGPTSGVTGFYNDFRTFGGEVSINF